MNKFSYKPNIQRAAKILTLIAVPLFIALVNVIPALAIGTISDGAESAKGAQQPSNLFGDAGIFSQISSVLLFIVGAIAVIMIIIGGLRYVVSGGDSAQVQSAKNTILYALIGIIIAILAYAAVNFVVGSFSNPTNGTVGGASSSYGASSR